MSYILTDIGEEYIMKNGADAVSFDIGLYNDTTDSVGDTDDIPLSTEPSNSNYSRKTSTFSVSDIGGDWGTSNDSQVSFDFSDQTSSEDVDSYFIVANFTSSDAGDSGASDHLIATGSLGQTRDIGSIDTYNLPAGDAGFTVD